MYARVSLLILFSLGGCSPLELWRGVLPTEHGDRPCDNSSQCFGDHPVCSDTGTCVPCYAASLTAADQACRAQQRVCAPLGTQYDSPGQCMECTSAAHCAAGQGCWHGTCAPTCAAHDQCPSRVCDVYLDLASGTDAGGALGPGARPLGLCVPPQAGVRYVDNQNCGVDPKTGVVTHCDIGAALTSALGAAAPVRAAAAMAGEGPPLPTRIIVKVAPHNGTPYGLLDLSTIRDASGARPLNGVAVQLYGSDDGRNWPMLGWQADKDAISVTAGMDLTLDGFSLESALRGVRCWGKGGRARVQIRRSRVTNMAREGILAVGCEVHVDRSRVHANGGGALALNSETGYVITNNFIVDNTSDASPAIQLDRYDPSRPERFRFRFNTVVKNLNNKPGAAGVLDCGYPTAGRPIEDSIIFSNTMAQNSQLSGRCSLRRVVVDIPDVFPNAIRGTPEFVDFRTGGDYRLRRGTAQNLECCIDKAGTDPADPAAPPLVDFDGVRRPQGAAPDIGAHEVL